MWLIIGITKQLLLCCHNDCITSSLYPVDNGTSGLSHWRRRVLSTAPITLLQTVYPDSFQSMFTHMVHCSCYSIFCAFTCIYLLQCIKWHWSHLPQADVLFMTAPLKTFGCWKHEFCFQVCPSLSESVSLCILKPCKHHISKTNDRNFTQFWSLMYLGSQMCWLDFAV